MERSSLDFQAKELEKLFNDKLNSNRIQDINNLLDKYPECANYTYSDNCILWGKNLKSKLPLLFAVEHNDKILVKLLIDRGADPCIGLENMDIVERLDYPPLYALYEGHDTCFEIMCKNINMEKYGIYLLRHAILAKNEWCIDYIISLGLRLEDLSFKFLRSFIKNMIFNNKKSMIKYFFEKYKDSSSRLSPEILFKTYGNNGKIKPSIFEIVNSRDFYYHRDGILKVRNIINRYYFEYIFE